jgi:hypothetical protein
MAPRIDAWSVDSVTGDSGMAAIDGWGFILGGGGGVSYAD